MRDATTDWRARDGSRLRADHPNELTALDLAKVLLDAGADPDKPVAVQMHNASMCCDPKANATPFYRAAVAADVEALKLLFAYDPDLAWIPESIKTGPRQPGNTGGKTALMVAMDGGKGVGMAGGPGDIREGIAPPFREVSNRNPVDAVAALLAAAADPDAKTPDGDTALHLAAFAGKKEIVRALVAGGADLNVKDAADKTALQVVSEQNPRPPRPTAGALVDSEMPAQPAEVAELLRELASGNAQASN
jgi:ankyrin repeat protein